MRETGVPLRRRRMDNFVFGVISVLSVFGAVSVANVENSGGESECERRMCHCKGVGWGS